MLKLSRRLLGHSLHQADMVLGRLEGGDCQEYRRACKPCKYLVLAVRSRVEEGESRGHLEGCKSWCYELKHLCRAWNETYGGQQD